MEVYAEQREGRRFVQCEGKVGGLCSAKGRQEVCTGRREGRRFVQSEGKVGGLCSAKGR